MNVFVTGGTGYMGSRLIPELVRRGHSVRALVRRGSEKKLPPSGEGFIGNALDPNSFVNAIAPADTFVHLIGVPHPGPGKNAQFRAVDLVSIEAAVAAASRSGIRHFVYLSVAQPAPVMKVYQEVRSQGERLIQASGISATLVRSWYVLGPGHWWPLPLVPFCWIAERLPVIRDSARPLGFVTINQMINTLVWAIENPPNDVRILGIPEIRAGRVMD